MDIFVNCGLLLHISCTCTVYVVASMCRWYRNLTWLCIPTILSVVTGFTTNRTISCLSISIFPGRFISLLFWPSSLRTKSRRINNPWSNIFRNIPFTRMANREDVPGICFNPTSSFVAIPTKIYKRLLREPTKLKCTSNLMNHIW